MLKNEKVGRAKKALIFSAYYEPEVASSLYLSLNLYEDMTKYGWGVELYVPMPTRGITNKIRKEYKNRKVEIQCDGKLTVHRFSMIREGKSCLIRAIRYLIINIVFIVKGLISPADLIFVQSTPPTQGAMAAVLKKFKKVPFVYNLQDIFPDSIINAGITKEGSMLWKIGREIEKFTYKNADKIIVISEDFKRNIMRKGVTEDKIEVVYNWVETGDVFPIRKEENILYNRYSLDVSTFYIVYAGNLGYAQNIGVILETAKLLDEYKEIQFLIFGKGAQEEEYKQKAKDYNLSNVQFLPLQPYEEVSYVYSLGDVSIVSCKAGFGGSAMPSKTWSIMASGTAVLANFDEGTDMQRIIENNNVGLFTQAEDVDGMKVALLKLFNDRCLCQRLGNNGRDYVLNNLTREIGTRKYTDIFESIWDVR